MVFAVAAAIAVGCFRPRFASAAAAVAALAVTALLAAAWAQQPITLVDVPWLPSVGSRFLLGIDSLSGPISVYATGMAVPVLAFAAAYLPRHLRHLDRDQRGNATFAALMLTFMLSMVLLILAQDLLVIFLALELTAITSFLLIRFDEGRDVARRAALLALVVTTTSSLLFLAGALVVAAELGTTALPDLMAADRIADVPPAALACIIAGALGKSAQVPLHFWLPRAMAAPTPVSAYLHSAALVAAGAFVLQRLHFLLAASPELLDGLFWLAFLSVAIGGTFALVSDELKRVLAYSTIAQYGYGVALVAEGGSHGLVGAPFFLLAHGLAKCALFMTAGTVTMATGEDRLSRCGGLARQMPLLAAASAVVAAGLAGMPLTIGFFKDDLILKAALERGPAAAALAAVAVALTLAYIGRFWIRIFAGRPRRDGECERAAPGMTAPVAVLAALVLAGGIWAAPLEEAFIAAGSEIARGAMVSAHLAYPQELSTEVWLTAAAWIVGIGLLVVRGRFERLPFAPLQQAAHWLGPAAWADRLTAGTTRLSHLIHRIEVRDLRDRLAGIFLATGCFVVLGILVQGVWPTVGRFETTDVPLAAALVVVAASALVAVGPLTHLAYVMLVSFAGFGLALVFALAHAPDVALVLVLVETTFTLLFLAMLAQIRSPVLARARLRAGAGRSPLFGIAAGTTAMVTAWLAMSTPHSSTIASRHIELAEKAGAHDVVTAILTDFRGLDTAGEITVLVVAIFGAVTIWRGRQR